MIFMLPEAVIRMFSGFTSRCTMPEQATTAMLMCCYEAPSEARMPHRHSAAGGHSCPALQAQLQHTASTTTTCFGATYQAADYHSK